MRLLYRFFTLLLGATLLWRGNSPNLADSPVGHYFPQTGHNVIGEFWTFYESHPEADILFGMPLTEQFPSRDGSDLIVQYFEKVRFELHSGQPLGERVRLSDLGTELYTPGTPALNLTTAGACRVLNGFGVCYDFLAFFDRYGGMEIFGNPISSFEFQPDGRLVQYFERARFEWHPEMTAGLTVQLADFGRLYANRVEDPIWFNAALPLSNIPILSSPPQSLRVLAFTTRAVTGPEDMQKLYVIVQDQASNPVAGATGTVTVRLTAGEELIYPLITDGSGLAVIPALSFIGQIPGRRVTLDVRVSYQGLDAATAASFLIWP